MNSNIYIVFLTLSITLTTIMGGKIYYMSSSRIRKLFCRKKCKQSGYFVSPYEHALMPYLAFLDGFRQLYTHTSSFLILRDNHALSSPFVHLLFVFHFHIFFLFTVPQFRYPLPTDHLPGNTPLLLTLCLTKKCTCNIFTCTAG